MNYDFNKATNNSVSIQAIRAEAVKSLSGIQRSLKSKGVDASLLNAKNDPIGDLGGLDSLIIDSILWFPVASAMGAHFPFIDAFNHSSAAAYTEGASIIAEDATQSEKGKLNDYPQGRRKCALTSAKKSVPFNLVSTSRKRNLSSNTKAEMNCMYEILDMLDKLDGAGARSISLESRDDAYNAIKKLSSKTLRKENPVRNYNLSINVAWI